jgi:intracellular multiplication protein IcmW
MPDLSQQGAHRFWYEYHDKMIYRVICMMEGVEQWTLDGNPELEAAITELGQELDNISKIDMNDLQHEDLFIQFASNIASSRALRLLQAIDTAHPGSASKLLIYAEENSQHPDDPAGLFLRRNIVFERLRLLGRVFNKERIAMILRILEGEDSEE